VSAVTPGTINETADGASAGDPVDPGTGRTPQRGRSERNVVVMDTRNEIRDFLTSRRARITPEQAGLPAYGGSRRVAGLRREEVALLAGVSVDYYTRLERGNMNGVSDSVLAALARALQLDEAERAHLFDLVRAAHRATTARRRPAKQRVRPWVQRILDAMTGAPAYVRNGRADPGRPRPPNTARFVFLDPRATDFFADWERVANEVVATLRSEAGRDPYDRGLSDLVGELSTQSEAFRTRWAAHDVRFHHTGVKRFHHPVVGDLTLNFETMELSADAGLTMAAYTAEPGSPSQDALNLLASWAATLDQAETARAANQT